MYTWEAYPNKFEVNGRNVFCLVPYFNWLVFRHQYNILFYALFSSIPGKGHPGNIYNNTNTTTNNNSLIIIIIQQNGVPPLSHTYILHDYIYDGTNKTKPKEIAQYLSKGVRFMVRTHARE